MIKDRDFTRVTFKVNAAGSWAILCVCDAERIDDIKKACEAIVKTTGYRVKFKYTDAEGGLIELYRGYLGGWEGPKTASRRG